MFIRSNQRLVATAALMAVLSGCQLDPNDMRPGQGVDYVTNPVHEDLRTSVKTAKYINVPKLFNTNAVTLAGHVFDGQTPYLDAYKMAYAGVPDGFLNVSFKDSRGRTVQGKARIFNGVYGSVVMGPKVRKEPDGTERVVHEVVGVTGMRTPPETLVAVASGETGGVAPRVDPAEIYRKMIEDSVGYVVGKGGSSGKDDDKKKGDKPLAPGEKPRDPNDPEAGDIVDDILEDFDKKMDKAKEQAVIVYTGYAFSDEGKGFFAYKLDLNNFEGKGYIQGLTRIAGHRIVPLEPVEPLPPTKVASERARSYIVLDSTDNVTQLSEQPYFPKTDPESQRGIPSVVNKMFPEGNPLFGVAGRAYARVDRSDSRGTAIWQGAYQLGIFGPNMDEIMGAMFADVPNLRTKDDIVKVPVIGLGAYRIDNKKLADAYLPPSEVHPELLPRVTLGTSGSDKK